jgi:DNA mismatch repair ATPase MutS
VTARLLPDMLRRLVREQGMSFEIWGQSNARGEWELEKKGSPGNFDEGEFQEAEEGGAGEGPGLMAAISVGHDAGGLPVVGVAYVDVLRSIIGMSQFTDVDTLANAETALLQLGARECVAVKTGRGFVPQLPAMLARADIALSQRPAKDFAGGAPFFSDLQRLLDPQHHAVRAEMLPEMLQEHAVAALAGLLRELELVADLSAHGKVRLVFTFGNRFG